MPCDLDAKYQEWKIVFESVLSTVGREDEITFVGHSLGGNFLLKYFGEQVNDTSFFVISSEAEKSLFFIIMSKKIVKFS